MKSLTKSALALSAIMLVSLAPSSQAEQIKQTVEAWSGVKLIYNSQTISGYPPPLTINNTVYVPLRNMMGYLNKDVIWNSSDNSVEIRDRFNQDDLLAKTTIASQEIKIKELENKIKDLENGGVPTNQSVQDELESNLNLRYKGYEGESFSITISGNERIISVKIVVTSSDWNDISSSKQNVLVENITDDILAKYPDAKISGTVTNDFSTLAYFYKNVGNSVVLSTKEDIINLEQILDGNYTGYFRSQGVYVSVTISGDSSSIMYRVNIDYNKYGSSWRQISDSDIKRFMSEIFSDIRTSFPDASIAGYVYDTYNGRDLAKYIKFSDGSDTLTRY